ncbi:O-antigen ligase family protein [Laribacter hongkongensis]|uniref:O-antigen ligase family protein n=2 Tax=Laribacter hongkongensis TaxID=168471 RepID=A0ABD4SVG4_9NEIS|nr:O-antigen ligase family protein [Laribacter hongkongensis]MCG9026536.1 O-antigen ligase family protein [Laribacter hongkongensis]
MNTSKIVQIISTTSLIFIFSLGFSVQRSSTSLYLILSALALILIATKKTFRNTLKLCWKTFPGWTIAMLALAVAITIREIASPTIQLRYADAAYRLFLAPFLLALIFESKAGDIKIIKWSWLTAVILMAASGYFNYITTQDIRLHSAFTNTIPYSAFCAVFAILFVTTNQSGKLISAACLILASAVIFYSQSRGVWTGVILATTFLILNTYNISGKKIFSTIALIAILAYATSDLFSSRADITIQQAMDFFNGNREGSVGMRMQLALASYYIFIENPIFGAGRNLLPALHDLYVNGYITQSVSDAADTHGELFYNAASLGIVGVIYYLIFYIFTTVPFIQAMKQKATRQVGMAGVAISIVFFFTGFTHITFGLSMYASIYASIQVVLLTAILNAKYPKT